MKRSLEKSIFVFSFVILSLTILANTGMDIAVFRRDFIQEKLLRSQTVGTALKGSIEKILALGLSIREVAGLSEKCREIVLADPEISYCVITDREDKPIFASDSLFAQLDFSAKRAPSESSSTQFQSTLISSSRGTFHDTATPVKSFDGQLVATIHLGFPKGAIDQKLRAIMTRSIFVLFLSFLASFALVIIFIKKNLVAPISTLLAGLKRIAKGEFSAEIEELPMLELNELANKINIMAAALKTRDAELHRNYEELSVTHSQLHNSFLQLEKLSLELEKSEEMYKKMLEDASDAIIILDLNQVIVIANKRSEDFFGHAAADMRGRHITDFLTLLQAENLEYLSKRFRDAISGSYIAEEIIIKNNNDKQLVGCIHASRIGVGDETLLQVIIRDATKERELLLNLERSAAGLARLNKMKDSFIGLASHELKTPLTVIIGYSELLLSNMRDELTETTGEMVQNISAAAMRLDSIVRDLIDMSMIDQRQLELSRETININTIVEAAITELHYFLAKRKQEVCTHLAPNLPLIRGDRTRVMQILSNILGNAIKFTPDYGKITVSTSIKRDSTDEHSELASALLSDEIRMSRDFIEIAIKDNGIGIDADDQLRIFDKFYEAGNIEEHSSGKVAFKARGTGLGLSIAKGVVEIHGGKLWVESAGYDPIRCPGSTFFIQLPIHF